MLKIGHFPICATACGVISILGIADRLKEGKGQAFARAEAAIESNDVRVQNQILPQPVGNFSRPVLKKAKQTIRGAFIGHDFFSQTNAWRP